ncbi:MAG: GNAT family N-acetyltransferase [Candidatus Limnocylindrales bacterium]
MTVDVRVLDPQTLEPAYLALERAFGSAPHPEDIRAELSTVDPSRFYAGFDGSEPVGTAGSFAFSMTVPGGPVPVAGVTWVSVLPTYRRQGLLHALMTRQLADLHDEGTAVAALWATEAAIYGRYGYGPASWRLGMDIKRGAAFRSPVEPGGLRLVSPDSPDVRAVYDAAASRTAGFPARDDAWWGFRVHDPDHRREGGSPLQCVLTEGAYALYSTALRWQDGLPSGEVRVREVVAATPDGVARVWRHLLDLDLMEKVQVFAAPPDGPLLMDLLAEPRLARPTLTDGLHVRLVDVPAALTARRYAADVDVVLDVVDERCPWNAGTWRLAGGRDGASCVAVRDAADLRVGVADLGAAYLGGTPLRSRAVVELTPGALSRATTAFGPLEGAPWCPQVF